MYVKGPQVLKPCISTVRDAQNSTLQLISTVLTSSLPSHPAHPDLSFKTRHWPLRFLPFFTFLPVLELCSNFLVLVITNLFPRKHFIFCLTVSFHSWGQPRSQTLGTALSHAPAPERRTCPTWSASTWGVCMLPHLLIWFMCHFLSALFSEVCTDHTEPELRLTGQQAHVIQEAAELSL